jgi:two-component system, OmpR family, sensor histidine kinase KdpD
VGFDHTDNYILSAAVAPNTFAQHIEGLPDARGITQEQFENPLPFLWPSLFQPLLGCFVHDVYYAQLSSTNGIYESLRVKGILNLIVRFAASAVLVCVVVFIYFRWLHVNPATVGFTFLLVVLFISAGWGLRYAIFAAVLATAAYNYFFLPPVFKFTIADPQNWIALGAFLITAVSASQLSERARRAATHANQRRREVEKLYAFSQQLWLSENVFDLLNMIPKHLVDSFEVSGAALFIDGKQETYFYDESSRNLFPIDLLKSISDRGEPVLDRKNHICYMPLRMGLRSVGALGLAGCDFARESLEAVGSLVAISIERANTVERLTKSEAARESDRLRSVLLDSVTHEFRTPLTAIKASAETLLSDVELDKAQRKDLLVVIDQESDRLNHLVGEAGEVAELDSHQLQFHFEPHQIADAIDAAMKNSQPVLRQHPVDVTIPPNLPPVRMDLERIAEVITHLLDNASKYSSPQTPIHVTAELRGSEVVTSVADRGPGIDELEQEMIFEKFYRGRSQRMLIQGTGMGLAIAKAIVELHGGKIGVISQPGRGSVFYLSLPVA